MTSIYWVRADFARQRERILGIRVLYCLRLTIIAIAWLAVACGSPRYDDRSPVGSPQLDALSLSPLLPGFFSDSGASRAYVAFAPDGESLYLARYEEFGTDRLVSIEVSRLEDGAWTPPETAPFPGTFDDHQPSVSPDGSYLYFVSRRSAGGVAREDYEPWRVAIRGDGWGESEHLASFGGLSDEYAPFVARSGRIYFSSTREGGLGSGDLYVAEPEGAGFGLPRNLGATVNGPTGEWGSTGDADESVLIFESSGRSQNLSESGDLYVSRRIDGNWTAPRHLPPPIASAGSDLAPRLSPDGLSLQFSTNRSGAVTSYSVPLVAALAWTEAPD